MNVGQLFQNSVAARTITEWNSHGCICCTLV